MKCDNCNSNCPQEELACEIAKERMYATNEVIKLQKQLEEYKQLEEQGLLLRLPCKVGDTVYYKTFNNNDIYPIKINEINILISGITYNGYFMNCTYEFDNSDFGKTVFLTQAEAKQKLKEMEND